METKLNKTRSIFVFHSIDEMRHPYQSVLKQMGRPTKWFTSFDELTKKSFERPLIVIVDLDVMKRPWEESVEELRTNFPKSDLIALSSHDSAQTALLCLRSGFADFLVKPLSPEELGWSVRKTEQRLEVVEKLDGPRTTTLKAVTQISSCTTPTLVRLCTLEYLMQYLKAKVAAWIRREKEETKILCSVPKTESNERIGPILPTHWHQAESKTLRLVRSKSSKKYKIMLSLSAKEEWVFLWGINAKPKRRELIGAETVVEHSEISILNIQKYEQVKQQTFIDDLTGLYNSRYLKFALANAILRCKTPVDSFAVLFIDVDHFKSINDKHNHLVGSDFLVAIGKTVRNAVRNIDPVFRYGGDEFVVILHETNSEGAREIAERIRKNIERRVFVIQGFRLQTTVSVGIAVYPEHASKHETLLKLADEAMFTAKKESRNAVHMAYGLETRQKPRRTGT